MGLFFNKFFISFDDFGHKQPLTYRGSETFQTRLGAICTIITRVLSLFVFAYYFNEMIKKQNPQVESYLLPIAEDEMEDTGEINLADIGFYFGIETLIDYKPKDIPPEVGRVKAEVIIITYDGSNE